MYKITSLPDGSYPDVSWNSLTTKLTSSESLVGTSTLVKALATPTIEVPDYTKTNPDSEGNYYGSGAGQQGGCFDGRYYYQSFIKYCYNDTDAYGGLNDAKNLVVIVKYDVIKQEVVRTSKAMYLDHVNDITYNSKTGNLVVCHNKPNTTKISYVDAVTLEIVESFTIDYAIFAIDYDAVNNRYVLGISNTVGFRSANADFTEFSDYYAGIEEAKSYTKQGICCDESYVYCLYYGSGNYTTDAIIVYDWSGNFVTFIEVDFGDEEPENISVVDGALFVGTGHSSKAYFYNISDLTTK